MIPGHTFLGYIKLIPVSDKPKDPFKSQISKPYIFQEDPVGMDFPFIKVK